MSSWQIKRSFATRKALLLAVAATALVATACGSAGISEAIVPSSDPTAAPQPSPTVAPIPTSTVTPTPEPTVAVDPGLDVDAFEELNPRPELRSVDRSIDFGFDEREALPRDLINPIYSPRFSTPDEVKELMIDNELVMGLNINGDVRAYPVGIMRFREIVNDEVGGIPLLVTW